MKQDLERMKRDFYSKAAVERFDEEHIAASNVVKVNGGRDDVGVALELHSTDIGTTSASKIAEGDGSLKAPNFGIGETTCDPWTRSVGASINGGLNITGRTAISGEGGVCVAAALTGEPKNTPEVAPSPEEVETKKEHKELHKQRKMAWRQVFKALVAMEFGVIKLGGEALIITLGWWHGEGEIFLAFMCDEQAHAPLSEVADAMLKEENVMDIEVGDENLDRLAIVPYVKPSSPLAELPAPYVEKLFLYQVVTSKVKSPFSLQLATLCIRKNVRRGASGE
ncbi:hypothetical protein DEO72_LG5g991 [Vigna unguiculata]|uniref:Uncharacterized protein n=1 Tax=Vigna unguiculata TaxID=3917 RepID=A0A4D6LVG5_VIGUN|nr:hypothetical protein DEO72_LG5g991 [Vigna unguiculata]